MTSRPDPASNGDRPASDCTITEQRRGDICLIAVTGALDALTIHQLEAAMSAHNALTPAARFAVVASGPATGRPLALVGIANIIDVYATLSEALIALAEKER